MEGISVKARRSPALPQINLCLTGVYSVVGPPVACGSSYQLTGLNKRRFAPQLMTMLTPLIIFPIHFLHIPGSGSAVIESVLTFLIIFLNSGIEVTGFFLFLIRTVKF